MNPPTTSMMRQRSTRVAPVSLALSTGQKLLLTGGNGTGKSTLLALIAQTLAPSSGTVWTKPGTSIGKLYQDVALPDPQRRLELAIILAQPPQILLLDEPTNHLALTLVTEVESALGEYPGIVVIASHDRWLRSRWQSEVLHLHETAG